MEPNPPSLCPASLFLPTILQIRCHGSLANSSPLSPHDFANLWPFLTRNYFLLSNPPITCSYETSFMTRNDDSTRPRAPVKAPTRCPACNGTKLAPKGTRTKKLETVSLYKCRSCGRTFTPGPRALRNKTYPFNEILDAITPTIAAAP